MSSRDGQKGHLDLLDGVRGVAITGVVLAHVTGTQLSTRYDVLWRPLGLEFAAGVDLFFALSGFLICRPFIAAIASGTSLPSSTRFACRRVLRIVPAYWLALTLLGVWPGLTGIWDSDSWSNYLFLQNLDGSRIATGIPVAWSLTVEVCFYLAVPFAALAMARLTRRVPWFEAHLAACAGAVLTSAALYVWAGIAANDGVSYMLARNLPGLGWYFAVGVGLAAVSVAKDQGRERCRWLWTIARRPWWAWTAAAACVLGAAYFFDVVGSTFGPDTIFSEPVRAPMNYGLIFIGILLFMTPVVLDPMSKTGPQRALGNRTLTWIGLVSYGIYLVHLTVILKVSGIMQPGHALAFHGLTTAPNAIQAVVILGVSGAIFLPLAAISWYLYESRWLRLKGRARLKSE